MESQKDTSFSLCRFCLKTTESMEEIFDFNMKVIKEIEELTRIKINRDVDLPSHICEECQDTVKLLITFRDRCIRSEELLSQIYKCRNNEAIQDRSIEGEVILETEQNDDIKNLIPDENDSDNVNLEDIKKTDHVEDTLPQDENEEDSSSDENGIVTNSKECPRKSAKNLITCHICGKQYEPSRLKYHLNNHAGHRPYACTHENCEKSFPSPFLLKSHKKICHTNFFPFTCDICGRQFKVRTTFLIHRSYHLDPDIPCTVCGKLIRNKRALKKHMMSHTGERPFSCNVCSKAFQNKYTLRVHQRVHTKEKPFICGKCGMSFGYNCLLKTHLKRQHNDEDVIL